MRGEDGIGACPIKRSGTGDIIWSMLSIRRYRGPVAAVFAIFCLEYGAPFAFGNGGSGRFGRLIQARDFVIGTRDG